MQRVYPAGGRPTRHDADVCEHSFVTAQGSAYMRFRRALDRGNVTQALSAASELRLVSLAEALELTLLLVDGDLEKYNRAALRWHVRFVERDEERGHPRDPGSARASDGDPGGRSVHLISPAVPQSQAGPERDGCLQGAHSQRQLDHLEAVAALSVRASEAAAIRCSPMPSSCSSARAISPSRLNCANRGSP